MTEEKKDYSKTVNLPDTAFPMKANLPVREPEFLKNWEQADIYRAIRRKNKGNPKFIFHDGPPYANGNIHLGTALNKTLKDFVLKFRFLTGWDTPFTPGWDCHGLPIEQQALKELKLEKNKVDRLEFRKQAAAFAKKFIEVQRQDFKRLGIFADWEKPYLTLDPKYEGVIIKVFGELAEAGFIYRQRKPVYWCPHCETALADAEVEYAQHVSHSVYVKFELKRFSDEKLFSDFKGKKLSVLIWTTTPWTLPANVALAFKPDTAYVIARAARHDGKTEDLVIAKDLLKAVSEKLGFKEYTILKEFQGKDIERSVATNPLVDRDSLCILADFVSMEDGTGIVHIAPGHGADDYKAGLKYGLPILSPVNHWGAFTDEAGEFAGHKVFAANQLIIDKLKTLDAMLFDEKISHSYPHCWRCKHAIIFRATPQWFMSIDHNDLRTKLIDNIEKVKWVPAYGEQRIKGMVELRPDWCLSRQRLWGVPIPVVYCENCDEPVLEKKVIDRVSELFSTKGSDSWFEATAEDLLKGLEIKCKKCGGNKFRKEEDILDVWFDSGVSNQAVLASGNYEDLSWPADICLEGSDQHRGWFQTSLIPSVALKGKAPYKTVLTHGFVVDGEGKKMSKSLGNVILPQEIISKYGADILRLWVASSDYSEDIRISNEILKGLIDTYRKVRNTLRFLLGNISDLTPDNITGYKDLNEIDRYALSKLEQLKAQVKAGYENYEFHKAIYSINQFCTTDLSGFYLDALKDVLYCERPDSEQRRSSQSALLEICLSLTSLLAPILCFTAEEVWQELRKLDGKLPGSVFLRTMPEARPERVFEGKLKEKWARLFDIKQKASLEFENLRKEKKIGSNMEARVEVLLGSKAEALEEGLLCQVLGTWDLEIKKRASEDDSVKVGVSGQPKCERCWKHIEGVNDDKVCPRCGEIIGKS
jgi:isoleucyl-tRNA synthetase